MWKLGGDELMRRPIFFLSFSSCPCCWPPLDKVGCVRQRHQALQVLVPAYEYWW